MAEQKATIYIAPLFCVGPEEGDQRTLSGRAFALIGKHLSTCRADGRYAIAFPDQEHLGDYLRLRSDERPFVRELVEEGRLDASSAYYQVSHPAAGGEALLRNLVRGLTANHRTVQLKPSACLVADGGQFGLQFPQLLARLGVEAVLWLTAAEDLPPLAHWMAPDGSTVILKLSPAGEWPEDLNRLVSWAAQGFGEQTRLGLNWELALVNAGEGPPEWLVGSAQGLAKLTPAVGLGTPGRYLSTAAPEAHLLRASLPCLGRDPGGLAELTALSWELSQAARLAEDAILHAERLTSLAHAGGARGGLQALARAWEQTLYAQGHARSTGGTWRLDLLACHQEAAALARDVAGRAGDYLASRLDTRRGRGAPRQGAAVVVVNTAAWPRTDLCEVTVELDESLASGFELVDDHGRAVPVECASPPSPEGGEGARRVRLRFVASEVPSLGWRTWYLRPARSLPPVCEPAETDSAAIENQLVSITAEAAAGGLTALREKSSGRDLLVSGRGPGAEVVALGGEGNAAPEAAPARLAVWEGPVTKALYLRRTLADGREVEQQATLWSGGRRVELLTAVRGTAGGGEGLALRLPLALPAGTAVCSAPFGAILRKAHNARLKSADGGVGCWLARDWVDLGRSPSLFVRRKGGDDGAVPLGPCAIISAGAVKQRAALRALEKALLSRGIPCTALDDTEDLDSHLDSHALRISLGRDNTYSRRLLERHPPAAACLESALSEHEWAAVLVPSGGHRDPAAGIPTLLADRAGPGGVAALADALARAVREDRLEIPESHDFFLERSEEDAWTGGAALLGAGPVAVTVDEQGAVRLLLKPPAEQGAATVAREAGREWRHALAIHDGDWREGAVERASWEFSHPLVGMQTALQEGALPADLGLCSLDHPGLVVTAVKPRSLTSAEAGGGGREIILRMYESHGKPCTAALEFGVVPEAAWRSDPREEREQDLPITRPRRGLLRGRVEKPSAVIEAGGNEIVTVGLRLPPPAGPSPGAESLDPPAEPERTFFSRFWEHNAGAAPVSGNPLTLWMQGELPLGKNTRFGLGLSNDSDRQVSGTVEVKAPAEWTLIPRQVPYRISAGSEAVYEIMVIVPADASPCFVRAVTRTDWGAVQDVLPVGEILPLSVSLTREEDGDCVVTVENPNPDYVEGDIQLILPPETWQEALSRGFSPIRWFRVEANSRAGFRFPLGALETAWAVARVGWYGNVQYAGLLSSP